MLVNFRARKHTFVGVLGNGDDQVIVRRLIMELTPPEVKDEIVRRFNLDVDRYNDVVRQQAEEASNS